MSHHPFMSSTLNIFDGNKCIFPSSYIDGQSGTIRQEQNRKLFDSTAMSILSNQHVDNCCCEQQPHSFIQPQSWSCAFQAQKQAVPESKVVNCSQRHYCVPLAIVPNQQILPTVPPPCALKCFRNIQNKVCVDTGKYGLEAIIFQEKLRRPSFNFFSHKSIGINDHKHEKNNNWFSQPVLWPKDQEQYFLLRNYDSNCKEKLQTYPQDSRLQNERKRICFPAPNPDKFESAKTLIIRKKNENNCRCNNIVDEASREWNDEEYSCYDCSE